MSISNATENNLLLLIFNATAWANLADNAATSPLTNIHTALHTADPGEAGTMSTNEATYTSYARVNVARSGSGFTVTGGSCSPAATITFATGTGGSGTVTHFAFGKTGGGTVDILLSGTVTPNFVTGVGVTPALSTSTTATLD